MQPTTKPTSAPAWLTTYGPLILSALALLIIAVAWILHDIDQATAIAIIGAILAGNGLVSATQWQAAPGLVSDLQQIIGQLVAHIQALHAQQITQQAPQLATIKTAAVQALAAPASPVPQQAFPAATSTFSNLAPGTSSAQASWPSPIQPPSRSGAGG